MPSVSQSLVYSLIPDKDFLKEKHPYECTYHGCSQEQKYFSQRSHQGESLVPKW